LPRRLRETNCELLARSAWASAAETRLLALLARTRSG